MCSVCFCGLHSHQWQLCWCTYRRCRTYLIFYNTKKPSTTSSSTTKHMEPAWMLFVVVCMSQPFTAHSISWKTEFHLNIVVIVLIVVFLLSHVVLFLGHLPSCSSNICMFVFLCRILVFTSLLFSVRVFMYARACVCTRHWLLQQLTKTFDWLLIFYHFVCYAWWGHTIGTGIPIKDKISIANRSKQPRIPSTCATLHAR